MRAALPGVLATLDTGKLRSSPAEMRLVLNAVVAAGEEVWTGPFDALVSTLREVARVDICLARLVEGHADAVRIIDQAGARRCGGVYGVWVSRSAGTGLRTAPATAGWKLDGELRFASGVGLIDRALVSASLDAGHHLLFDIDAASVDPDETSWNTAAMDASRSFTVQVGTVVDSGSQVGAVDFYLTRPGFVVGGLAVAAVWAGGARHVVDAVATGLRDFAPTAHQHRRVGLMDQASWTAELAVTSTAGRLAVLSHDRAEDEIGRTRTAVVLSCDTVLEQAPLVVGPGGLSTNARLSRALADLAVYIRQHHLDAATTRLGAGAVACSELMGS